MGYYQYLATQIENRWKVGSLCVCVCVCETAVQLQVSSQTESEDIWMLPVSTWFASGLSRNQFDLVCFTNWWIKNTGSLLTKIWGHWFEEK